MDPGAGIDVHPLFGFCSLVFIGVGIYIVRRVLDDSIETSTAVLFGSPILVCWIAMNYTMDGDTAWIAIILGILSLLWCIGAPLYSFLMDRRAHQELIDQRMDGMRKFLEAFPSDTETRFKLAESLEDSGRLQQAYEEYSTCLSFDPKNSRTRYRITELYRRITKHPLPDNAFADIAPAVVAPPDPAPYFPPPDSTAVAAKIPTDPVSNERTERVDFGDTTDQESTTP